MICPKCGAEMRIESELVYIPDCNLEIMEVRTGTPWGCRSCNSYFVEEFTYGLTLKKTELYEGLPSK